MNPDNDRKYVRIKKVTLLVAILIIAAGLTGWILGRSHDSDDSNSSQTPAATQPNTPAAPAANRNADTLDIKSTIGYTLPDGWKEAACPNAPGSVFISPNGGSGVDCDANPSAAVKLSGDPANNKDCNQLQNVQNVSKHICISEYINGRKSLKAETVYNQESSFQKETAVNAYYIDTGKGVVKVEYQHDPGNNQAQSGFEQLAKSIQVK